MALYNNVTTQDIKQQCTGIANEIERYMLSWKYFANKIGSLTTDDLDVMNIDTDYSSSLTSLKNALLNIELKYRNQTPITSDDPSATIGLFTQLRTF